MISHLGRYEIVEELGRGAMGIVYKARDPLIERYVAVKTINLEALPEKERKDYAARFYQEAKAAGHLNHRNIVTIHDLGESGDVAYIAMELMEGRELQTVMDGLRRLPAEKSLYIAAQVAEGLYFAHQRGIVHRDIKPSNIMLLGDDQVKIADFGIAKMSSSLATTKTGMIIGSPLYMSPEQIRAQKIDARSDIFSLGVVLYQMLTGKLPFNADDAHAVMYQIVNEQPAKPSSLNPDVPDALDKIVYKCLAKNPDERYKDAQELADELKSCRDKLQRAKAGMDHPLMSGKGLSHLRKLATPGSISPRKVAMISYFWMAAIFAIDLLSGTHIQMHMFYIFPLILIGYHCEDIRLVRLGNVQSLVQQSILLVTEIELSHWTRIVLGILVILSNIMVVYVARIARANFLEVGNLLSFDKLTGLRNRLSFETIVDSEIMGQRQHGGMFSFAYVDINNLRELNEAKGYPAGDEAVKLVAKAIRENIRSFDTASRLGGDEFAILMPNTKASDCKQLCSELSARIAERLKGAGVPISTSIGYVTFDKPPVSISEAFHVAEQAMLAVQAKR